MDSWFRQSGYGVRFEWGAAGAEQLAFEAACLVVVDVLSFSTAVTVAAERGMRVFPYRWRDGTAADFAARVGAELAVGRRAVGPDAPWSLSPAALRRAPFTSRLVLPSPNGSAIAAAADAATTVVVAASLRNAAAVGGWLAGQGFGTAERPVAVIASGEHRADGSLRPALEDLLGAGAVIAALTTATDGRSGKAASPEAAAAAAVFTATRDVRATITDCASGRELTESGYAEDVAIALETTDSTVVPILTAGAFTGLFGEQADSAGQ
jgi:2-phosphosulfolactate phosphatase